MLKTPELVLSSTELTIISELFAFPAAVAPPRRTASLPNRFNTPSSQSRLPSRSAWLAQYLICTASLILAAILSIIMKTCIMYYCIIIIGETVLGLKIVDKV